MRVGRRDGLRVSYRFMKQSVGWYRLASKPKLRISSFAFSTAASPLQQYGSFHKKGNPVHRKIFQNLLWGPHKSSTPITSLILGNAHNISEHAKEHAGKDSNTFTLGPLERLQGSGSSWKMSGSQYAPPKTYPCSHQCSKCFSQQATGNQSS